MRIVKPYDHYTMPLYIGEKSVHHAHSTAALRTRSKHIPTIASKIKQNCGDIALSGSRSFGTAATVSKSTFF